MVWGAMRHDAHSATWLHLAAREGSTCPRRSKGHHHNPGPLSPSSAERRLVERPELAAVQLRPFAPQLVARLDADPHMLADRAFVEAVGLAGKLQFAVERLVRDAEQRAIGDAEAIALAGDGRRLHVDGDGARLREAERRFGIAQ